MNYELPLSLSLKDPLNETSEDPTSWTFTTLSGEPEHGGSETKLNDIVDSAEVPSLKLNLTVINSTLNYTMTKEVRILENIHI